MEPNVYCGFCGAELDEVTVYRRGQNFCDTNCADAFIQQPFKARKTHEAKVFMHPEEFRANRAFRPFLCE